MKILIYRWSVFHQEDIAEAFESFGHTVEYYEEMPDERKGTDIRRLKEVVAEYDQMCIRDRLLLRAVAFCFAKQGGLYVATFSYCHSGGGRH